MYWIFLALSITGLILGVIKVIISRQADNKRLGVWFIELIISLIALLCSTYLLFTVTKPTSKPAPLTKEEIRSVICEWEDYKHEISTLPIPGELSNIDTASLYNSARCLLSISKNALDSGLVAIGLGNYDNAIIHLSYAVQATSDSTKRAECYFYIAVAFHDLAERHYQQANFENGKMAFIQAIAYNDICLPPKTGQLNKVVVN